MNEKNVSRKYLVFTCFVITEYKVYYETIFSDYHHSDL